MAAPPPRPCQIDELSHTAEVGFEVRADTGAALFACAAEALFAVMRPGPPAGAPLAAQEVALTADGLEFLLVDWLNELLYLFETTHAVFSAEITTLTPTMLQARVTGRPSLTPPTVHIKAVTYHQLEVRETESGWLARVFVDI